MIREPPPFGGLQLAKYTIHNQGMDCMMHSIQKSHSYLHKLVFNSKLHHKMLTDLIHRLDLPWLGRSYSLVLLC